MTGTKLVQGHPGNSNLFAQYTGQLELCSFEDHPERRVVVRKTCAIKNLSTFKWQFGDLSSIVACGSFSGHIWLLNWNDSSQVCELSIFHSLFDHRLLPGKSATRCIN